MRLSPYAGIAAMIAACGLPAAQIAAQVEIREAPPPLMVVPSPRAAPMVVPAPVPPKIPPNLAARDIPAELLETLNSGMVREQYIARILTPLRTFDRDRDGLDRGDVERVARTARAGARAYAIGQMLRYDLDGDFIVTSDELREALADGRPDRDAAVANELKRWDIDGDGSITLAEAAKNEATERTVDDSLERLLRLDPDRDGRLTVAELSALAERAFAIVDQDGDGIVSRDEAAAIAEQVSLARWVRTHPACDIPTAPRDAGFVVLGVYDGQAVSSAAVGGQDQETNLIDLTIEPGKQPLYLVLSSYESMVWRFTGDTRRIAQVLVHSYATEPSAKGASSGSTRPGGVSASGVIGVPAAAVMVLAGDCMQYFYKPDDGQAARALAQIERGAGRKTDAVFGAYSPQAVALPSGTITQASRTDPPPLPYGFDESMWQEASRFWPAGLAEVDPAKIVTPAKVENYSVLPSQMGLAQLLGSGAIERLPGGAFRIVRPIPRLPSSMGGAHLATFYLAKGVPLPPGDPVHACVIAEETGEAVVKGPICTAKRSE